MRDIPKIVITGGPCAGKTTGMAYLVEKLSDYGFEVATVPEIPTFFFPSGLNPARMKTAEELYLLEKTVVKLQLQLEAAVTQTLDGLYLQKKKLILCDRGSKDHSLYFPDEYTFEMMAREEGYDIVEMRDSYAGVIHLVSTAFDKPEVYEWERHNNPVRTETLEQAIARELKTRECWLGHPHFKIIDNSTDFEEKKRRVLAAVCRFLGIPAPREIERKFLVTNINFDKMPPHQIIHIEQIYLKSDNPDKELRIRKRGQGGSFLYFLAEKWQTDDPIERVENEKIISSRQFREMRIQRDPGKKIIKKDRICFLWENQYFELDIYKSLKPFGLMILEIELTEKHDKITLPPFLKIAREVTSEKKYFSANLASIK